MDYKIGGVPRRVLDAGEHNLPSLPSLGLSLVGADKPDQQISAHLATIIRQALRNMGIGPGDGLMLGATIAYATYGVLLRRWAMPIPTWQSLYIQVWFAVLFLLPWYLLSPPSSISASNLSLVLYAAIPASILAPFLWMTGIRLTGPNNASRFMNLLPVFVAAIAWLFLNESLHYYHLVGGVTVLAGVWLGQGASANSAEHRKIRNADLMSAHPK